MFKRLSRIAAASAAAIVLLSTTLTGAAQAQRIEWRGGAQFYNFSAACAENGWSGTFLFNTRFRPSGLGDNGLNTSISFFGTYYAFAFVALNARFGTSWLTLAPPTGAAGALGTLPYQWNLPAPEIRLSFQSPSNAALTATSPTHRMIGQIRNFDNTEGCTVSFETNLMLRR